MIGWPIESNQSVPMKVYFVGYIAALVALVVLDALWLGAMSRDFYKVRLGQLLLEQPNWYAAILFYLVHALGIGAFAVPLAGSWYRRRSSGRCSASASTVPMT
jgi:hypothetical protein